MPFMKGLAPIRRTLKYLEDGNLYLKDYVKIVAFHFADGKNHDGLREFLFWHGCQLQYKNPDVQMVGFYQLTPTPFIHCYLDSGEKVLIDCDGKEKDDIHDWLKKIICKSQDEIEEKRTTQLMSPAYFGFDCPRHCICEVPGQVPCPRLVPLPKPLRGKYRIQKHED